MSKKYFINALLVGLLLGILAVGTAVSSTLMDEAEKLNWDKQNIGALKALFPNATSVETFLKEVNPVLADVGGRVGEYEITDLGNNGMLELLATIDVSGRAIYNTVYVVQKVNNTLRISDLWAPGTSIGDLKSCIVDLNNDGRKELLLPRVLAEPKFGIDPRPIINDVYEWDKTGFRKANASFKTTIAVCCPASRLSMRQLCRAKSWTSPHRRTCSRKSMRGK